MTSKQSNSKSCKSVCKSLFLQTPILTSKTHLKNKSEFSLGGFCSLTNLKDYKMANELENTLSGATAPKSTTSTTAMAPFVTPSAPATPAAVANFITQGSIAITTAIEVMKSCPAGSGLYSKALDFAQKVAGMVLDEGVKIADAVRAVGNTLGSGEEVEKAREEKEKIMTSFGFQEGKRFRNICELDADCVEEAKKRALQNGDVPSINSAIRLKPKGKKKSRIPKYECHGIFSEAVLSDDIKLDTTWKATSLCANIGLGTYMLKDLNIEVAVANELLPDRVKIHRELYPNCNVIEGSITDPYVYKQIVAAHKERNCRIVLTSCPCQSFSRAGKQNINREDSVLIMTCMQFLEDVNDSNDFFMCENVPEFLGACPNKIKGEKYDTISDYIKQTADRLGYITNIDYLNAENYSTGEDRNRSIVLGIKKELVQKILGTTEITDNNVWEFPKPDEFKVSEEMCLHGIPSIEAGEHMVDFNRLHYAPDLEQDIVDILKEMCAGETRIITRPNTKNENDFDEIEIKRAHGDRPAPTITGESSHFRAPAHCFPAGRNRTDGTQSDARHRTPYEILVLMGMPRDFDLPEKIKIQDGDTIWCKDGPVPVSEFEQTTDDIVVSDEAFRTMLGEHYCPTVVSRCFKQLIYQIQNKDF